MTGVGKLLHDFAVEDSAREDFFRSLMEEVPLGAPLRRRRHIGTDPIEFYGDAQ